MNVSKESETLHVRQIYEILTIDNLQKYYDMMEPKTENSQVKPFHI